MRDYHRQSGPAVPTPAPARRGGREELEGHAGVNPCAGYGKRWGPPTSSRPTSTRRKPRRLRKITNCDWKMRIDPLKKDMDPGTWELVCVRAVCEIYGDVARRRLLNCQRHASEQYCLRDVPAISRPQLRHLVSRSIASASTVSSHMRVYNRCTN